MYLQPYFSRDSHWVLINYRAVDQNLLNIGALLITEPTDSIQQVI